LERGVEFEDDAVGLAVCGLDIEVVFAVPGVGLADWGLDNGAVFAGPEVGLAVSGLEIGVFVDAEVEIGVLVVPGLGVERVDACVVLDTSVLGVATVAPVLQVFSGVFFSEVVLPLAGGIDFLVAESWLPIFPDFSIADFDVCGRGFADAVGSDDFFNPDIAGFTFGLSSVVI